MGTKSKTVQLIDDSSNNISPATDITSIYYETIENGIDKRIYVYDQWPVKFKISQELITNKATNYSEETINISSGQKITDAQGNDIKVSYVYQKLLPGTCIYQLDSSIYNLSNILFNYVSKSHLDASINETYDKIMDDWDKEVEDINDHIKRLDTSIGDLSTYIDTEIDASISNVKSSIVNIESKIKTLNSSYIDLNDAVEKLNDEIGDVSQFIANSKDIYVNSISITDKDFLSNVEKETLIPDAIYKVELRPVLYKNEYEYVGRLFNKLFLFNDNTSTSTIIYAYLKATSDSTFNSHALYAYIESRYNKQVIDIDVNIANKETYSDDEKTYIENIINSKQLDEAAKDKLKKLINSTDKFLEITYMKDSSNNEANFDFLTCVNTNMVENQNSETKGVLPLMNNQNITNNKIMLCNHESTLYNCFRFDKETTCNDIKICSKITMKNNAQVDVSSLYLAFGDLKHSIIQNSHLCGIDVSINNTFINKTHFSYSEHLQLDNDYISNTSICLKKLGLNVNNSQIINTIGVFLYNSINRFNLTNNNSNIDISKGDDTTTIEDVVVKNTTDNPFQNNNDNTNAIDIDNNIFYIDCSIYCKEVIPTEPIDEN